MCVTTPCLPAALIVGLLGLTSSVAWGSPSTILATLVKTNGAQTLVAAVQVVDEARALDSGLAALLDDHRAEIILFAPSNAAFERLLGLKPRALQGRTIEQVKAQLPSLLPSDVGVERLAAILRKHVALPWRANPLTASETALLARGMVQVADESVFPVSLGSAGVQVNYETTIIKADVFARNGVIHYIGSVIVDGLR